MPPRKVRRHSAQPNGNAWPEAGVNRRPPRLLRAEDKNTKKIGSPTTTALSYSTATSVVTHFRPKVSSGCSVYMASNKTLVVWNSPPEENENLLSPSAEFLFSQTNTDTSAACHTPYNYRSRTRHNHALLLRRRPQQKANKKRPSV